MARVVVVGSLNADLVVAVDRLPGPGETVLGRSLDRFPGGKGLNQAVAAARLGADVALVGAIGDDEAGAALAAVVEAEGVRGQLRRAPGTASGTALIEVASSGENRIVVVPGANALLEASQVRTSLAGLGRADVVLAQAEIPAAAVEEAMAAGRAAGAVTVLNASPADGFGRGVLRHVDVVVVNEHEATALTGVTANTVSGAAEAARALRALGPSRAVVTRGGDGCLWAEDDDVHELPAYRVEPVDTVGAGDAFCGALVAALAESSSLAVAVRWAAAAGAMATTRPGAVPSLPTRAEVAALAGSG